MPYELLLDDMVEVFKEIDPKKTIISIPANLNDKVKSICKKNKITSTSEYITFLLRLVLSDKGIITAKNEEKKIKERLQSLGYL